MRASRSGVIRDGSILPVVNRENDDHDCDPDQPTRSATTFAGIEENSSNNAPTRGSNASNADGLGGREYVGGASAANARATVFRATPNRSAIACCDAPPLREDDESRPTPAP